MECFIHQKYYSHLYRIVGVAARILLPQTGPLVCNSELLLYIAIHDEGCASGIVKR